MTHFPLDGFCLLMFTSGIIFFPLIYQQNNNKFRRRGKYVFVLAWDAVHCSRARTKREFSAGELSTWRGRTMTQASIKIQIYITFMFYNKLFLLVLCNYLCTAFYEPIFLRQVKFESSMASAIALNMQEHDGIGGFFAVASSHSPIPSWL